MTPGRVFGAVVGDRNNVGDGIELVGILIVDGLCHLQVGSDVPGDRDFDLRAIVRIVRIGQIAVGHQGLVDERATAGSHIDPDCERQGLDRQSTHRTDVPDSGPNVVNTPAGHGVLQGQPAGSTSVISSTAIPSGPLLVAVTAMEMICVSLGVKSLATISSCRSAWSPGLAKASQ